MMKLNGKTYLDYHEVETVLNIQLRRFSTSQHIILPANISYIDAELVSQMKNKSTDIHLGLGFLYKDDEYVSVQVVLNMIRTFLVSDKSISTETTFLRANLTDTQKQVYRDRYGNYLFNTYISEICSTLENK